MRSCLIVKFQSGFQLLRIQSETLLLSFVFPPEHNPMGSAGMFRPRDYQLAEKRLPPIRH